MYWAELPPNSGLQNPNFAVVENTANTGELAFGILYAQAHFAGYLCFFFLI
jgi:hypothetical protein